MDREVERIVALLEAKLGKQFPAKRPALRLVDNTPPPEMDEQTRLSHIRMILHLNRRWRLSVLVDQATFGRGGLGDLTDAELVELHQDLHRARECIEEGVAFEDAGLIRNVGGA